MHDSSTADIRLLEPQISPRISTAESARACLLKKKPYCLEGKDSLADVVENEEIEAPKADTRGAAVAAVSLHKDDNHSWRGSRVRPGTRPGTPRGPLTPQCSPKPPLRPLRIAGAPRVRPRNPAPRSPCSPGSATCLRGRGPGGAGRCRSPGDGGAMGTGGTGDTEWPLGRSRRGGPGRAGPSRSGRRRSASPAPAPPAAPQQHRRDPDGAAPPVRCPDGTMVRASPAPRRAAPGPRSRRSHPAAAPERSFEARHGPPAAGAVPPAPAAAPDPVPGAASCGRPASPWRCLARVLPGREGSGAAELGLAAWAAPPPCPGAAAPASGASWRATRASSPSLSRASVRGERGRAGGRGSAGLFPHRWVRARCPCAGRRPGGDERGGEAAGSVGAPGGARSVQGREGAGDALRARLPWRQRWVPARGGPAPARLVRPGTCCCAVGQSHCVSSAGKGLLQ